MNMTVMMLAEKVLKGTEKLSGVEIASMTIIGLGIVFSGLLILVAFLYLSGGIFKKADAAKKKSASAPSAAPAPVKAAPAKQAASATAAEDDEEVIAVISAAIAAMGEADGKQYRLHSVKPVTRGGGNGRSAWAQAGIHDATRPF